MSGYGWQIRRTFAVEYTRIGNATHALRKVLGEERANRMKPHTLRARASELLNDYRTVELIDEARAERMAKGEPIPKYYGSTYTRFSRFSREVGGGENKKDPPVKVVFLRSESLERSGTETVRAGTHQALIAKLMNQVRRRARRTKI